jgi:hypothetical protein
MKETMEAIYKLNANEINTNLMDSIKKLFHGKEVTIIISSCHDETSYLTMNPANEKHLMESIAQEPEVRFTPDEFKEMVKRQQH